MTNEGLFEFARRVAENLDGWQFRYSQPFDHAACLDGPDGAGLMIGVDGYGDFGPDARIKVSGRWPEAVAINQQTITFYPRGEGAAITAAVRRGPKTVARDVERRLLPKYLPLYREMAERKARYLAQEARRRECLERLAVAAGGGDLGRVAGKLRLDAPGGGWGYAEVGVYDDGEKVALELHLLPFGKALELVRMLTSEEMGNADENRMGA